MDCAIAEGQFHDLNRSIYWICHVRAWRRKANVTVGTVFKKTGRTTNFTTGRITAINATIDVGYGGGKVARFKDQIVTTNMSAGGDSGSLVLTLDNIAVGGLVCQFCYLNGCESDRKCTFTVEGRSFGADFVKD